MRPIPLAIAICFSVLVASAADAQTARCKDASGKFIKCPPAAAAPAKSTAKSTAKSATKTTKSTTASAAKSTAKPTASASASTTTRCKDAQGKFIKCPGPTVAATAAASAGRAAKAVTKPATAAATRPMAGMPTGATARCKDGTYSMSKTRSGTCSQHGGVANWL